MFTSTQRHHQGRRPRRGVALILVLGMLGLMALIAVTFATYSGQAEVNAKNFSRAKTALDPAGLMDYALQQLIDDTANPLSALRGHSMRRDMYGNDAAFNGTLGDAEFEVVTATPDPADPTTVSLTVNIPGETNTSTYDASYQFDRWIMRFPGATGPPAVVARSLEILEDNTTGAQRIFTVKLNPLDDTAKLAKPEATPQPATLARVINGATFTLDGRYLRAFNGPGMGPVNSRYPNFRVNGTLLTNPAATVLSRGEPNNVGMDEDYDACDLENWFLAIQSADGQVVIPSFHRPGILRANDWNNTSPSSAARFLRPRQVDKHSPISFPDLNPDSTGKVPFDVDNDGDGVTDAVWLDLGYPATRDASGRLMKPMFAFTVIGLNGRIPLNTTGNLQKRDLATGAGPGTPLYRHASHLGNSPSEVDPTFALGNAPGGNLLDDNNTSADVSVALTQLRNLLAGTRPAGTGNQDANLVAFDASGRTIAMPNNIADADETGTSRSTVPPVAGRWGEGQSVPFATALAYNNGVRAGLSRQAVYGDGGDDNFNKFDPWGSPTADADYYDNAGGLIPPVERIRRFVTPIDVSGNGRVTRWGTDSGTGSDAWGRVSFLNYFRPSVDIPGAVTWNPTPAPGQTVVGAPATADVTNNRYHGFESYRNPKLPTANTLPREIFAGLPDEGLNEADEMNLYAPSQYDAPFGPADLEWLYRKHDSDGSSLDSRLARLAPVSFTNPVDGLRRRRLFSIETWETNQFVWAVDNPRTHANPDGAFPENLVDSRFLAPDFDGTLQKESNAGFSRVDLDNPSGPHILPIIDPANPAVQLRTPALAHRDRKINLNYPLPVSNSPEEPVRQKWIREAYQLCKAVLPPEAVDSAEELRQLSQYLVNVIDFRDPDCTLTRFENRDLVVTHPTLVPEKPAEIRLATTPPGAPVPPTSDYLIQHGMEYSPVAINEVLAYEFLKKGTSGQESTSRLFVELVNTLTEADTTPQASEINLDGWDLVIMKDDVLGCPDPFTGQIPVQQDPNAATDDVREISLSGGKVKPLTNATGPTAATGYHYVLGESTTALPEDENPPTVHHPVPALKMTDADGTPLFADQYYWLYLRRPANPFEVGPAPYDESNPNKKRVVVDSFRFIFNKSLGTADPTTNVVTPAPQEYLFSLQRLQPYRGGHAVPTRPSATPPLSQVIAYGYSEQTVPTPPPPPPALGDPVPPATFGKYGADQITKEIRHTLGSGNIATLDPAKPRDDWDYVPFHDRDFTSVAELLLVPGCPPGLFTKAFAEAAPPIRQSALNNTPPGASTNPQTDTTPTPQQGPQPPPPNGYWPMAPVFKAVASPPQPHTFPYLVDNFFYTGSPDMPLPPPPVPNPGVIVGGPSGAGWFKMMEFFEVPSPVMGAIGPVEQGMNFDWQRQDLRPGLLNLNLIIDDEVFFSILGDDYFAANSQLNDLPTIDTPTASDNVPRVVTEIATNGSPSAVYSLGNFGHPKFQFPVSDYRMKAAFSDFLKLRHGGSGYLFAFGTGNVGDTTLIAADRPYHALSYPDINYTVMRPATLPPSRSSTPIWSPVPWWSPWLATETPAPPTRPAPMVWDPGVKNPYIFRENNPVQPPPIPPRRLFQIPDAFVGGGTIPPSNASEAGDPYVTTSTTNNPTGMLPFRYLSGDPTRPHANLSAVPATVPYLGGLTGGGPDQRQHPYFRTEWLQRVMNLTTVRTHQYAVWVTVGFFEVTRPGNPQLAATFPDLAVDLLGEEIGLLAGQNVRHRSFFIVDRTRLTGQSPSAQDTFSNAVLYRRRIQ